MKTNYRNTADFFMIVMAVIIAALVLLAFKTLPAHAMSNDYSQAHNFTGGSECHAYNTTTGVIQPVYDYCHVDTGKPADKHIENHNDKSTVIVADQTPVIDILPADKPTDDKPADKPTVQKGNPGNDKAVGNAGEKCNKGMCENADQTTGEHGKSKND